MLIDVIIPAYKAHDTINKAVASVVTQKIDERDELCLTIVNDGEEKGAYDYLKSAWYGVAGMEIRTIDREKNGGCGLTRQSGIDGTCGDCFMFLDADDVLGSPFAVRTLAKEIRAGYDLAMGMFVEETPFGTMLDHGENYVWCHGKMYARGFIDKYRFRFNETRYNEDVGFHSAMRPFANAKYIQQVVYIWENNRASTTREKEDAYRFDYGWRSFIENIGWAIGEMEKRNAPEEKEEMFIAQAVARMYWDLNQSIVHFPENAEINTKAVTDFYRNSVSGFAKRGLLPYSSLAMMYFTIRRDENPEVIPLFTFDEYLKTLGYFNDTEGKTDGDDSTGSI